jgi:hypothetical protein
VVSYFELPKSTMLPSSPTSRPRHPVPRPVPVGCTRSSAGYRTIALRDGERARLLPRRGVPGGFVKAVWGAGALLSGMKQRKRTD